MNEVDRAAVVALAGLPDVGPRRLRDLVACGPPSETWCRLRSGEPPAAADPGGEVAAAWIDVARRTEPASVLAAHHAAGIGVILPGEAGFPAALAADHAGPPVLFHLGDPCEAGPDLPVVALVGTRRSTAYGEGVAFTLGAELAAAGVRVCSGLALGIDGAAHRGALSVEAAPPVAFVANGLERCYPARHASLWRAVGGRGVIWSEVPMKTAPAPWRFPLRNRLIAALGQVVVVVESAGAGGSFHTVKEADARGRTVMAVPGPVGSRASVGTNQLLVDGCPPARHGGDVLCALGLQWDRGPIGEPSSGGRPETEERVLDAFAWRPATIDDLIARTGLDQATVAADLANLVGAGLVEARWGAYERAGRTR